MIVTFASLDCDKEVRKFLLRACLIGLILAKSGAIKANEIEYIIDYSDIVYSNAFFVIMYNYNLIPVFSTTATINPRMRPGIENVNA